MVVYFSLKIKLGIIGFQIWFLFLVYKRLSLLYTDSWNIIRTDTNVFSSLYYNLQHNNYLNQKHVLFWYMHSVQFSSVTQLCLTLCKPMKCSTPGLTIHHQLPEFTQIHVHRVDDAIQPSHPLSSPSPPALNPSQHQGLFQWVYSSHEVAKVLEFQLQHQSFQWTPRTGLL